MSELPTPEGREPLLPTPAGREDLHFDAPLLACCGRGGCYDPESCGTCAIAVCLPCGLAVLHGRSTRALLGPAPLPWFAARPGLTLAVLTCGGWLLRAPFVAKTEAVCYPLDVHAPGIPAGLAAACARGRTLEAVTLWVSALMTLAGLSLAAARRVQARRAHGLGRWPSFGPAGRAALIVGDVLAWLCCPACATCQEARTARAWKGEEEVEDEEGRGCPGPPPPFSRGDGG